MPVQQPNLGVLQCLRHIFVHEGIQGLFKGLGPNLMGVFPSRAIYFWSYSTAKRNVNAALPKANRDTPFVHVTSAALAGKDSEFQPFLAFFGENKRNKSIFDRFHGFNYN